METDVEGCYKLGARTSQIPLYDRDILQKMHNDINGDEVKFPNLPESSKTNDVNDDVGRGDVNCGWFSCCPRWLQKMCNASWLLFVMSMATFFQGFFISGCIPSSITSLERRFGFSSQQTGLLISTFDIVTIILVLPVVYIGGRGHKIRWVSVGSILIAIAAGLFALPHFTSPVYSYGGSTGPSFLCTTGNASVDECASSSSTRDSSDLQNYYYMFVGAMIIGAIGSLPLYTLGIAALDESVTSTNNGIYMGIFFALGALGPGCGYLLAGLFLSFFTELEQPEGLTLSPQDPGWVGAWWIGFLISSGMLLIIALPMSLFPHELPTTAKIRAEKGDQSHKNSGSKETSQAGFGKKPSDFIKAIKFLIVNPTFMFTVLGGVADTLFTVSFGTFLPKFFENQFSISASLATILTGIIVVIGGIIGTLTGGMIMRKLKLKVPGLLKLIIIANVLNGLMLLITLLHCPPAKLAGVTTSYENTKLTHNTAANVSHSCNSACSCAADSYIPVCAEGSDMEYLSPCHAGCIGEFENGTFTECACLGETNMSTSNRVSFGACSSSCPLYYPFGYAAVTAIVVIIGFTCSIPEINVLLRCVPDSQRSMSLGLSSLIKRILGAFPGPILFGAVIDGSCLLWQDTCGTRGSCWVYNNWSLAWRLTVIALVLKLLAVILFVFALVLYKTEDKDKKTDIGGKDGVKKDATL